jgi:serine/threonine protein kinase
LAVHHYQANILINEAWHAVLADFGLAVFVDATANTSHSSGSTRWMAPELSDPKSFDLGQSHRTPASDVYAFACACLEVGGFSLFILFIMVV